MKSGLHLWDDESPRDGPLNMAVDEVLLERAESVWLRVYRWDGPWVSIGWFTPAGDAEAAFPGRPGVRRWTGGGMVDHACDWTYTLVVPRRHPLGSLTPAASYHRIHEALAQSLRRHGCAVDLATPPAVGGGGHCFRSPVAADLVHDGRKIAGAAQRRTRHGLLHQGSVQGIKIPDGLAIDFARALTDRPPPFPTAPEPAVLARAEEIARTQYATPSWWSRR